MTVLILSFSATAQQGEWTGQFALAGAPGPVEVFGELDGRIYLAGMFTFAGDVRADGLAVFDPATGEWSAIGEVMGGSIAAFASDTDGNLYVVGSFTSIGGISVSGIARYTPATDTWAPLGDGVNGSVRTIVMGPDGALYAGGSFTMAGGQPGQNLARWDGTEWEGLEGPGINGMVFHDDVLYVTGSFTQVNGIQTNRVAAYNITTSNWSGLGSGLDRGSSGSPIVTALAADEESIFFTGWFDKAIQPDGSEVPVSNVVGWDINSGLWYPLAEGTGISETLAIGPDGLLYSASGGAEQAMQRWDGSEWQVIHTSPLYFLQHVNTLLTVGNRMYVGLTGFILDRPFDEDDTFVSESEYRSARSDSPPRGGPMGDWSINYLYVYEPGTDTWDVMGNEATNGISGDINVLTSCSDDSVYAAGWFHFAGTEQIANFAHWNGSTWKSVGQGVDWPAYRTIHALFCDRAGMVYVGGFFSNAYQPDGSSLQARGLAVWDSNLEEWRNLAGGLAIGENRATVNTFHEDPAGMIYIGGTFNRAIQSDGSVIEVSNIVRWNPQTAAWEAPPEGHMAGSVRDIVQDKTGALYLAGSNRIVRLDPATNTWSVLRESTNWILALAVAGDPMTDGVLYAGGAAYSGLWQWINGEWTNVGGQQYYYIRDLAINGNPLTGGELYVALGTVQRWTADGWSDVVSRGIDPPRVRVLSTTFLEDDKLALWVGGKFFHPGYEIPASGIARWETEDLRWTSTESEVPGQTLRLDVYPNPSFGQVAFAYTLPETAYVQLVVYDLLGREVRVLTNETHVAGEYEVTFTPSGLSTGTYVVRLNAGSVAQSKQFTLVR